MFGGRKRRNDNPRSEAQSNKKGKTKSFWSKSAKNYQTITGIETGTQGIFATCDRGREAQCVAELYELLEQCASKLYDLGSDVDSPGDGGDEDIEASIEREISNLKEKKSKKIVNVKIDLECVVFFHTKAPCVPTEMVHALLECKVKSKWVYRLTPVTRTGKATLESLEDTAKEVLRPYFHEGQDGVKFAIRPTMRNHNVLNRDQVIKVVADVVGPKHKVDLKNYDALILVDIYKASYVHCLGDTSDNNLCGVSVVRDFERFKKYNLQEVQKDSEIKNDIKDGSGQGATEEDEKPQITAK